MKWENIDACITVMSAFGGKHGLLHMRHLMHFVVRKCSTCWQVGSLHTLWLESRCANFVLSCMDASIVIDIFVVVFSFLYLTELTKWLITMFVPAVN